jgi:Xaa-Pro aminopeptidase
MRSAGLAQVRHPAKLTTHPRNTTLFAQFGGIMVEERSYRDRREAVMAQHAEGLVLVRGAASDGVNPNFRYLTGLSEPRGLLLLAPEGARIGVGPSHPGPDYVRGRIVHQILFLPAPSPLAARWGEDSAATVDRVGPDSARVDAVLGVDELDAVLDRALQEASVLHYVRGSQPTLAGDDDSDVRFLSRVRDRFFGVTVRDATPTVDELRRSKDEAEIRAIERAAAVTAEALDRVLGLVRAGMHEHEVEGEITRVYRAHGATHAFEPIVACGVNAVFPHYKANAARIEPGQLLLIDTGAVLDGYASDVTRTLPVDGRFDDRQREIYDTVLRAQREAIDMCRPGALIADIHAKAFEVISAAGFGEQFIHGTSHHLGLETHDVGNVHRPLTEGSVITVEPGIYLPDEAIGVRIEDDVLVTADGPRILTEGIPATADDVERRMA